MSNSLKVLRICFPLFLSAFLLSGIDAFAQDMQIKGTVKDENGEALFGAGVLTADGKRGTVTDMNGNYTISVSSQDKILRFSFISYETQEVNIGGRTKIDVTLLPDKSNALNDVVVIGYGTTKKSDLTGSVASVKMGDLESGPKTSIDQTLQGRIAGVDVMNTTGEPGATTSIRIRGTRSINASNEPLIIVDGVLDAISDMSEINSDDVESISVMKDASATAIYGSRGANGVINITTKKGVTSKPSVTARAEYGVSQIARKLDLMNKDEFVRYLNDIQYFRYDASKTNPAYNASDYVNDTDWMNEITRIAPYQNYNVSVSGKVGTPLRYFGSVGYNNHQGVIKESSNERFNARLNLTYDFSKWFTLNLKLSYTLRKQSLNKANIGGTNFWDGAIYLSPLIGPSDRVNPLYENGTAINTPVAVLNLVEKFRELSTMNDVVEFVFKPLKGLTIKSQNSYTAYQQHDYQFWPSTMPNKVEGEGADAYRSEIDRRTLTTENTIAYNRRIRRHNINALLGYSASTYTGNSFSLKADGLLTDALKWNNMAGITSKENYSATSGSDKVVKQSGFARINYNYDGRYHITATGRFDGSSNFAQNHKWGFFPSAAFKWVVTKEKFMRRERWINDLSLRLSAGLTGNDAISTYRSLAAYTTTTNSYPFDGSQGAAVYPNRIANPNLTWEKTTMYNFGLDMAFLKNRLAITVEGYLSYTKDLLLYLKTIQSTGYDQRMTNIGLTSNKGVELTIDAKIFEKKKFGWSTQFTLSHNKQMVEDIGQEDYVSVLNSPGNTSFMMYGYKTGYPLNSLWGFQYAGVWHNEQEFERNKILKSYVSNTTSNAAKEILGYPKYVDQDNDGVLTENDLIYLGNSDPVLFGGWQNTFNIGQLKIGFFFSYSLGGKIYNYSELSMAGSYTTNQYRYMLNAWHPVRNPESDYPRAGTDDRMLPSSFAVHDASYLRLKNASVSYTFDLAKKTRHLRDITLGVSGTNLFLITKYNGFDPDVSTNNESTLRRVDMGAYPQSRMVIFSLQVRY